MSNQLSSTSRTVEVFYDGECPLCLREIKLLKWLVWPSRLPGISHALNFDYRIFAKNRLRLTGRCATETCEVK